MRIRTLLFVGVAAIAALVAVGLAVVGRAPPRASVSSSIGDARGPGVAAPQDGESAAAAQDPDATSAATSPVSTALHEKPPRVEPPPPEITPPVPSGRRSAAATIAWERVPIAARAGQLGPDVSGAVVLGLRNARAQMDSCFADEAKLLAAGGGPRFDPNDPPSGPGALTLLLQSRPGGVDVVGTEVVSLGTCSPQLVSCVRHVLEGWPIEAPKANGGRRYRLRYTIQ